MVSFAEWEFFNFLSENLNYREKQKIRLIIRWVKVPTKTQKIIKTIEWNEKRKKLSEVNMVDFKKLTVNEIEKPRKNNQSLHQQTGQPLKAFNTNLKNIKSKYINSIDKSAEATRGVSEDAYRSLDTFDHKVGVFEEYTTLAEDGEVLRSQT